jgi:hypothetical protein
MNVYFITTNKITEHNNKDENKLYHLTYQDVFRRCGYNVKIINIDNDILPDDGKGVVFINIGGNASEKEVTNILDTLLCDNITNIFKTTNTKFVVTDISSVRESSRKTVICEVITKLLHRYTFLHNQCNVITNATSTCNTELYKVMSWEYFESFIVEQYFNKHIKVYDKLASFNDETVFRFLCYNNCMRFHRYLLVFKLYNTVMDFKQKICCSLREANIQSLVRCIIRNGQQKIFSKWLDLHQLIKLNSFFKKLPFTIDWEKKCSMYDKWDSVEIDTFNRTCIKIVTETTVTYQHAPHFLTEKTYKPILCKMPFIICGQPHSLEYLKSLGYKTFDAFWDESYDKIKDPEQRIDSIVDIVNHLSQLTEREFKQLLYSIMPIVEYNYQHSRQRVEETNRSIISFILQTTSY